MMNRPHGEQSCDESSIMNHRMINRPRIVLSRVRQIQLSPDTPQVTLMTWTTYSQNCCSLNLEPCMFVSNMQSLLSESTDYIFIRHKNVSKYHSKTPWIFKLYSRRAIMHFDSRWRTILDTVTTKLWAALWL